MGRNRQRSRDRDQSSGLISRRHIIAVLGGGSVGIGALYGTGAFSRVSGPREAEVTAAGDEEALLGFDPNDELEEGDELDLFTLENRFSEDEISVEIEGNDPDDNLDTIDIDDPGSIGAGDTEDVTGELSCAGEASEVLVEFTVTASGSTHSVELERSIELTCTKSIDPSDCDDVIEEIESTPGENGRTETGGFDLGGEDIDGYLYVESNQGQLDVDLTDLDVSGAIVVNGDINGNSINITLDNVEVNGDICIKGHNNEDTTPDLSDVNNVSGDVKADVDGDADFSDVKNVEGKIDEDANINLNEPPQLD